jgi:hypothetical protein
MISVIVRGVSSADYRSYVIDLVEGRVPLRFIDVVPCIKKGIGPIEVFLYEQDHWVLAITNLQYGWPFLLSVMRRKSLSGCQVMIAAGDGYGIDVYNSGSRMRCLQSIKEEGEWVWFEFGSQQAWEGGCKYDLEKNEARLSSDRIGLFLNRMKYPEGLIYQTMELSKRYG